MFLKLVQGHIIAGWMSWIVHADLLQDGVVPKSCTLDQLKCWDLCRALVGFQIGLRTWQFLGSKHKLFDNSFQLSYSSCRTGVIPSTLRLFSATMTWDPRKLAKLKLLRCRKVEGLGQVKELLCDVTSQLRGYQSLQRDSRRMFDDIYIYIREWHWMTYDRWIWWVDMY